MRKLLVIPLLLLLLAGCREQPKEYISPDYQKIREEFAPTEYIPPAPSSSPDETEETVIVTPIMPLQ